jgi:hypothetical protein
MKTNLKSTKYLNIKFKKKTKMIQSKEKNWKMEFGKKKGKKGIDHVDQP